MNNLGKGLSIRPSTSGGGDGGLVLGTDIHYVDDGDFTLVKGDKYYQDIRSNGSTDSIVIDLPTTDFVDGDTFEIINNHSQSFDVYPDSWGENITIQPSETVKFVFTSDYWIPIARWKLNTTTDEVVIENTSFDVYGSTSGGITSFSGSRMLRTTKIGNLVFVECIFNGSAHDGEGTIKIDLPYFAESDVNVTTPILYGTAKPDNGYALQATIAASTDYISINQFKPSTSGLLMNLGNIALPFEDQDQTLGLSFSMTYRAQ